MKRYPLKGFMVIMVLGMLLLPSSGETRRGMRGMMSCGDGSCGWYCPYCGRYMGSGMMAYQGGLCMGPGMMGYRGGMCVGPGYSPYQLPTESVDEEKSKDLVEDYLQYGRNPNLKIGEVKDKGSDFEVCVVTKDGSLVDKILINKNTGWMRSTY